MSILVLDAKLQLFFEKAKTLVSKNKKSWVIILFSLRFAVPLQAFFRNNVHRIYDTRQHIAYRRGLDRGGIFRFMQKPLPVNPFLRSEGG